ncbi:MAG: prephenate/arogenate dehydrogenase family protein [Alphaproteobacteria bacterium]
MTKSSTFDGTFDTIALIGVGLIGSSIARAIKKHKLARRVIGCDKDAETRRTIEALGLVDKAVVQAAKAVDDADLVIICTPVSTYAKIGAAISRHLKEGSILTDVGSVKGSVIRQLFPYLPIGVHFIPAHPVAGAEQSGPKLGFAEMFEDRWCIITPPPDVMISATIRLEAFWRRLGSRVARMDPDHHDRVLAMTSHLPHLIAYAIVGTIFDLEREVSAKRGRSAPSPNMKIDRSEVIRFSAGGFRDFTRIAGSDPIMWRDIFLHNKDSVLEMLGRFIEDLLALQRAIRWGDGEMLQELFTQTREVRRGVVAAGQAGTFIPQEPQKGKNIQYRQRSKKKRR